MITREMVEQVQRLLKNRTLSHRRIAEMTGMARSSVQKIARGILPKRLQERNAFKTKYPSGPFLRCPGCGGKCQMPCMACSIEREAEERRRKRQAAVA